MAKRTRKTTAAQRLKSELIQARQDHLRLALQASGTAAGTRLTSTPAGMMLSAMADIAEPTEAESPGTFTLDAYSGGVMYPVLNGVNWQGPVVVSIEGLSANASIPVHRDHDRSRPVGHARVDLNNRIRCDGVFSVDNADSAEIRSSAKRQFPWRASIGLSAMVFNIVEAGRSITTNGQTFDGPILHVTAAHLDEVSFVTIAGDNATAPAIAAHKPSGVDTMNFSQWLKAKGWDEAKLTDAQKAQLMSVYDAEQTSESGGDAPDGGQSTNPPTASGDTADTATTAPPQPAAATAEPTSAQSAPATAAATQARSSLTASASGSAVQRARLEAAAEEERIASIRAVGSRFPGTVVTEADDASLTAHAIREGWTSDQTELYALRAHRASGPAIHSTSPAARGSLESLQAGIMLRAGRSIDQVAPHHDLIPDWMSRPVNDPERQRIMNNAQEFRDLTMIEYTARGLQAMGHRAPAGQGMSGRLATLQAGFSTGATAAIFTQSIGAMAIAAYSESGDFSVGWTSEADVPNLLPADRVRMQAAPDLTHQPTGDEAKHAHREAKSETVRADRFSRTAEIDENDFINDRFSLLREIPRDFGRAAARLRPNMVAAVLLANAALKDSIALFHASHGNLLTGSPLSQANLQKARAAMSKQKDGDASLNLQPTHLIVPSDLGDLAIQLTMSAIITNDSGAGGMNPTRTRNIMPVEESRLSNGVVDPLTGAALSGSLTSYYLASSEAHTIEVQFLDGTGRVPQVVVEQLSHGKFGLSVTVKHFIGAKALDFRGLSKILAA